MARIVVDINHPAHVHYFKNFIREMERRGHKILITASDKEISYRLLSEYGFDFIRLGNYGNSLSSKAMNIPVLDVKMYYAVRHFKPDVFFGFGSIRNAHVSRALGRPSIAFDDSEPSPVEHLLYVPFTNAIVTPTCFKKDFGKKHVRYNSYTELAYLHPKYFSPDPATPDELGVDKNDRYVVMRFVGWKAGHDLGRGGFTLSDKKKAVRELEKHARVFITSELKLPGELEKYRISLSPIKMHDILYYAQLLLGDSQTMTTEASLLGTPAIRCNSFVGEGDMGNFLELERKYGLIFNYRDSGEAIGKAVDVLKGPETKGLWKKKRERLLTEKIDVTAFMVWFVENYPQSFRDLSSRPEIQGQYN